jgi:hypothetical protein
MDLKNTGIDPIAWGQQAAVIDKETVHILHECLDDSIEDGDKKQCTMLKGSRHADAIDTEAKVEGSATTLSRDELEFITSFLRESK